MVLFTPPSVAEVPPVGGDSPSLLGGRLMRFFQPRQRGVAVFKMSDGTYRCSRAVPGVTVGLGGTVPPQEPYPAVPEGQVVNDALGWSWYAGKGTEFPLTQPTVQVVYYGGTSYQVSSAEAAALSAAGFGGYLS